MPTRRCGARHLTLPGMTVLLTQPGRADGLGPDPYGCVVDITYVSADAERLEVRDFLAAHIPGIASTAVPATAMDAAYAPLVPVVRAEDGRILAAALTCRSQVAAAAAMTGRGEQLFGAALERHSELDLLAVAEDVRGQGLGTLLIKDMQERLVERGVRVWFGNVSVSSDADRLRGFYSTLGFKVLGNGQPLPPLLGKEWIPPFAELPAYFFYRRLPRS